jgi:hypothetical protein
MDGNTASFQPSEPPSRPQAEPRTEAERRPEAEPRVEVEIRGESGIQARAGLQPQAQAAVRLPAQPQVARLQSVPVPRSDSALTYPAPGLALADAGVRGLAALIIAVPLVLIFIISSLL